MFERRARIVLICLVLACFGLLLRAGQLQIAQAGSWRDVANEALRRSTLTESTRGRILDRNGEVLAEDVPCNDAAVAFWFVNTPADESRIERLARDLARQTPGYYDAETDEQLRRVEQMKPSAHAAVGAMWDKLAEVGGISHEEMQERRKTIMDRVEIRRRAVIRRRHRLAVADFENSERDPWWQRWLVGDGDTPPELAEFEEPIADEEQAHLALHDLTNEQYNTLVKYRGTLPPTLRDSLTLRASRTRRYPRNNVAAHVIGRIAEVDREALIDDPERDEERRRYFPGDLAGKAGLEKLAERDLRGTRGRIDYDLENGTESVAFEPEVGRDVTTTLDAELCDDIREAFNQVDYRWPGNTKIIETGPMPGAAVVIDLKTSGVLAMVSAPDFDPNTYAENSKELEVDEINRPLWNRAVYFAAVPGSTVKPVVGLSAIAAGHMKPHDTIECDGYFHVTLPGGKKLSFTHSFRCWTASMFGQYAAAQRHGSGSDPHPTPGLNPGGDPFPGHITLADALQRSCNVFFQTAGTKLGIEGLAEWYDKFGLGRPTGVGLPEKSGLTPRDVPQAELTKNNGMGRWAHTWWSSIGQGYLQATPMQMANVAATIARGGIWTRPTLLADEKRLPEDRVDLKLDASSLDMARRGMWAAVHTPAGSGQHIDDRLPLEIAGKTGSAQAAKLTIAVRDAEGNPVYDENGRATYQRIDQLSTHGNPNPLAPWYRQTNDPAEEKQKVTHAWFIGYAPANDPQVAFAVFVEYGGSGGYAAGSVAAQIVQSLVDNGYLKATRKLVPDLPEGERRYVID